MLKQIRARVISQERDYYRISDGEEERLAEVSGRFRYDAKQISDYPAVGDYVIASWPDDGSNSIIDALFPRKSAFIRKAAGTDGHEQVVAANIDIVCVCMSLNRDFNPRRLERYIATAWDSGATPLVVLTKADLCDDIASKLHELESITLGVDVLVVSSLSGDYEGLLEYLKEGTTLAFMGSSGVGKSTLINKLLGEDVQECSGIRNDDRGRHTTTRRELIELPCGAFVIDTPGMRELGMWDNSSGIESAFSDIEELIGECRFSDCSHSNEPGCAVRRAIADGSLDEARWNSYLKLKTENEYSEDSKAYLQAKREKFRAIAKINRKQ